jgi:hypothetical protein
MKNISSTVIKELIKVGGVILIFVIAIFLIRQFFVQPRFSVNLSQASVIKEVRELQRLETASFTIEKIIDAKTNGNIFQELLYGDKILLIAHGEVIAGFDFNTLKDDDLKVTGKRVEIQLPAPQILFSRLDNEMTRVYDRQQGLLSKGQKDMESEARKQAEISIRQAACEGKILDTATENGRKQLMALFNALGFTEVDIRIPEGKCQ